MDFDEWVWRRKITLKKIGDETGICPATLSHIKNRKIVPKLDTALMLSAYSDGEISLNDLLPDSHQGKVKKVGAYNKTRLYKDSCKLGQ